MAYVNELPWHGLGNQLSKNSPLKYGLNKQEWHLTSGIRPYAGRQKARVALVPLCLFRAKSFVPFRY